MSVGDRISQVFEDLGLKSKDIVEEFSISQQYVSNIKKAENINATIAMIAQRYKVNLNWLVSGQGDKFLEDAAQDQDKIFLNSLLPVLRKVAKKIVLEFELDFHSIAVFFEIFSEKNKSLKEDELDQILFFFEQNSALFWRQLLLKEIKKSERVCPIDGTPLQQNELEETIKKLDATSLLFIAEVLLRTTQLTHALYIFGFTNSLKSSINDILNLTNPLDNIPF